MASILDIIASETHGSSFKTYKYGFDGIEVPRFDYDDHQYHFTWKRYGETETHKKTVPLKRVVDQIVGTEPLFHYFLDSMGRGRHIKSMICHTEIRFIPLLLDRLELGAVCANKEKCFH